MGEISRSIEVARLFRDVMTLLRHHIIKSFKNLGITAPQGMVMGILSKSGKMKISELSDKMGLSDSTVSGIIDRLEIRKIVQRERSKEDRRTVYVSICPEFEKAHKDCHIKMEENVGSIISRATPEEIEKIEEALKIMKRLFCDTQE